MHHDQIVVYRESLNICVAKDQVHHDRTMHIGVRCNILRNEQRVKMMKIGTIDNMMICLQNWFHARQVPTLFGLTKCFDLSMVSYETLLRHEREDCICLIMLLYVAFGTFLVKFGKSVIWEKIQVKVEIC